MLLLGGCARPEEQAWRHAETLWAARDPSAFESWRALGATTSAGASAQLRLAQADARYREGVPLLAAGDPRSHEVLASASALGPPDPQRYLELARACRVRGLDERAATL